MAVSGIQAVLEFLRKNGLSKSESALMEDLLEKSGLQSVDFERVLFRIAPPAKIPASREHSEAEADSGGSGDSNNNSSDSEEFVSLCSSTSDGCSSEFTHPYGAHVTRGLNSQASSDRLSQFGTARDYQDFDIENDSCWYNEKDEDYTSPLDFGRDDSFLCPSEDKFVMNLDTGKHISEGFQTVGRSNYQEKSCPFSFCASGNGKETYYHRLDENGHHEDSIEKKTGCTIYDCSVPSCVCCSEAGDYLHGSPGEHGLMNLKDPGVNGVKYEDDSSNEWADMFKNPEDQHILVIKKDLLQNGNDDYEGGNARELAGDPYDCELQDTADEGEVTAINELLMYDTTEDECEVFDLRIIHRKKRTGFEESKDLPIVLNSIIAGRYYVTEFLGSAAFSRVVQAHDLYAGMDVCLKIIKNDKDFFDQSLDEIKLLKYVNKHDPRDEHHILRLYDYFYCQEHLFIVCELLQANLYEFQKYNRESGGEPYFTLSRLQLITRQCLEALEYLHQLGIIHCDLKPENILIKSYKRCEIKVIDLGSSCFQLDNLCLYVQSRSYRAPEVILGLPYNQKIDLWSLGCILAELCSGQVLFPNDALVMSLGRLISMLGPIDMEMLVKGQETYKYFTEEYDLYLINEETNQLEYIIPEESSLEHHMQVSDVEFINFVRDLLEINPKRRPTAREALEHPWLSHQYGPS